MDGFHDDECWAVVLEHRREHTRFRAEDPVRNTNAADPRTSHSTDSMLEETVLQQHVTMINEHAGR